MRIHRFVPGGNTMALLDVTCASAVAELDAIGRIMAR